MLPLDAFVILAVRDQHGGPDRAQLLVAPVRLALPHLLDLVQELVEFLRRRREALIFRLRARDELREGRVLIDVRLQAGSLGVGAEREHATDTVGMTHRHIQSNDGAIAPTDDGYTRN